MIRTSETITKISQALLAFQGEVDGVGKNKANPAFKSQYATLEAVIDTAKPSLQSHGLLFIQSPGAVEDGSLSISTRIIHAESGEWIEGTMQVPLGKKDPQGAGSATTYGLRYSLMAMLGMPAVDDDGEGAMDRAAKKTPPAPKDAPQDTKPPVKPELSEKDAAALHDRLCASIAKLGTIPELNNLWGHPKTIAALDSLNDHWYGLTRDYFEDRIKSLSKPPTPDESLDRLQGAKR